MTITRNQLQEWRDHIRECAKPGQAPSASIGRAANEAATSLDQLDACLVREGLDCIFSGGDCRSAKEDGQEK